MFGWTPRGGRSRTDPLGWGGVLRPTVEAVGGGFWQTEARRSRTTADATRTARKGGRFRVFYGMGDFGREKPRDSNGVLALPSEVVRDAAVKTRRLGCQRRQHRAARRSRRAHKTPARVRAGVGGAVRGLRRRPRGRLGACLRRCSNSVRFLNVDVHKSEVFGTARNAALRVCAWRERPGSARAQGLAGAARARRRRPRSPTRRRAVAARALPPTTAAPPVKGRFESSLARRLPPLSAARASTPNALIEKPLPA